MKAPTSQNPFLSGSRIRIDYAKKGPSNEETASLGPVRIREGSTALSCFGLKVEIVYSQKAHFVIILGLKLIVYLMVLALLEAALRRCDELKRQSHDEVRASMKSLKKVPALC